MNNLLAVFFRKIRNGIFAGLCWLGVPKLAQKINRKHQKVAILMYHSVAEKAYKGNLKSCLDLMGMVVSEETFRRQMSYLSRNFHVIRLDEYIRKISDNEYIEPNSIVITFDDGFIDNFSVAYPILKKYGLHATFFPIGNSFGAKAEIWLHYVYYLLDLTNCGKIFIEIDGDIIVDSEMNSECEKIEIVNQLRSFLERSNDRQKLQLVEKLGSSFPRNSPHYKKYYMTTNEIDTLSAEGFLFGGHTMSHRKMSTLSFEQKRDEIVNTKHFLDKISTSSFKAFVYPHGQKQDFDNDDKQLLAENGFPCALTTIEGLNKHDSDLFELKRIEVGEFSHSEFVLRITGVLGAAKACVKKILRDTQH